MSRSHSDWPAVPDFHPEFGLLCPSPRRRRSLRLVVLSVVTTMAIGATMGLAVAHWPDGEGLASTVQPMEGPAGKLGIPASATQRSEIAAGVDALPAANAHESCKAGAGDLATFFLNPTCGSSKLHARHGGRAGNRVATVVIGRTDAAPATQTPVAAAAIEPSQAIKSASVAGGATEKSATPAMAQPPKKPKTISPPRLGAPIALTPPGSGLGRQNAVADANASPPRFGRDSFDTHGDTSRVTTLQSGFDASFGRYR